MAKYLGSASQKMARMAEGGQVQGLRTAADVAAAEVAALEGEMQDLTAAGQLAGLVAERAKAGSYRGQLGVMTQIREDFERMAGLLTRAAEPGLGPDDRDAVGDELPRIDRIILYVDDLDRCPPRRVVEMLEAIHLLLAVPLFVTVVAVDPRWLLQAIAAQYPVTAVNAGPADPEAEELWRSTRPSTWRRSSRSSSPCRRWTPAATSGCCAPWSPPASRRPSRPAPPPAGVVGPAGAMASPGGRADAG